MASEPDEAGTKYVPAEYRVRIYLSVDLSGSTAFKNSREGIALSDGATPKWVSVFQHFYSTFPSQFRANFLKHQTEAAGSDGCPELWKAVGDELVFCGRVRNKKSVITALSAFISTMHGYRKHLISDSIALDLKGAGWIAAFPEPNRAVQLRPGDFLSATEALEAAADERPFDFDFLGKAIDSGFRVAASATTERFALCAQLARLLVGADPELGFAHEIRFDQPVLLKGVNRGEPYPVLYIDTMTHLRSAELRKRERDLLNRTHAPTKHALAAYLKEYCELVGTDEIMLGMQSNDASPQVPESYAIHREAMARHLNEERGRFFSDRGSASADDPSASLDRADDLKPLSDEESR